MRTSAQKINELLQKKQEVEDKLAEKYKNFHGVRHENSVSEIRYTEIKVLEDYLQSIVDEIESLKKVDGKGSLR